MTKRRFIWKVLKKDPGTCANLGIAVFICTLSGFRVFGCELPYTGLITTIALIIQGCIIWKSIRRYRKAAKWWKWHDNHDWYGRDLTLFSSLTAAGRPRTLLELYDPEVYFKYGPCQDPAKHVRVKWEIKK